MDILLILLLIFLSALVLGIAQPTIPQLRERRKRRKFLALSAIAAVLTIWLMSFHHTSQPSAQIAPSPLPVPEVLIKPRLNSPTSVATTVLTRTPTLTPKPPSPKITPKPIAPPKSPKPLAPPTPETKPKIKIESKASTPIRNSVSGSCECPYDTDKRGRSCGGRSAYSRPGGRAPKCYSND